MIDRGDCKFVEQVRNAQTLGAMAVLIANNGCICSHTTCEEETPGSYCEREPPIMRDEYGSGRDISIPTLFMFKEDADPVKAKLLHDQKVAVSMAFEQNEFDNDVRVRYDLWASPLQSSILDFKNQALALRGYASFTPHVHIYDGQLAGCVDGQGRNDCSTLCTNEGRYCAPDPDGDLEKDISGADIVKESLRRICIWKRYGYDGIGVEWWDYVRDFAALCRNENQFRSRTCISKALLSANIDEETVNACMKDSGGLEGFTFNSMLDEAIMDETNAGIVAIPSMTVDNTRVEEDISAPNLFREICRRISKMPPKVCIQCSDCRGLDQCFKTGRCPDHNNSVQGQSRQAGVSIATYTISLLIMTLLMAAVLYFHRKRQQQHIQHKLRNIMVRSFK